jgi:hypothetical protein
MDDKFLIDLLFYCSEKIFLKFEGLETIEIDAK